MKNQAGYSLLEVIVVIVIVGILAAISAPVWKPIFANASQKEAARNIASALRDARAKAISENFEHRINFDLATGKYDLEIGNRTTGSTTWTSIKSYQASDAVEIKGTLTCNNTNFSIQFNPNGTANSTYACITDKNGTRQFAAGVSSAITGRVIIRRWDTTAAVWE